MTIGLDMGFDLVFNERSLSTPAPDRYVARTWMSSFVQTLRAASAVHRQIRLRTHESLDSLALAPGYALPQWRNGDAVEREERQYVKSLVTKTPLLVDLTKTEQESYQYEFTLDQEPAVGFGAAYLLETLAVSIASADRWNAATIEIDCAYYDDQEELVRARLTIPHASVPGHVRGHAEWMCARLQAAVGSGVDLWNRRGELYPALRFCDGVADVIKPLPAGAPLLQAIQTRLQAFENYCRGWSVGGFDPDALASKATPESSRTLQQYAPERTVCCPDGVDRVFSWHVRMTPGAWRIYFLPLEVERKLLIGLITPHLRTARFN